MLKLAKLIFYTELILLLRCSHEWLYPLGFFIIIVSIFPFAFTPDAVFLQTYVPGCIWIAALLATLLSIENVFFTDLEEGHLEQLVLNQTPLSLFIFVKLAAHWLVTILPLILLIPLFGYFFHLPFIIILLLGLSLLLGSPILILIGSVGVALTLGLRQQGILLGLIILPLLIPVLIFGVSIVQQSQAGLSIIGPCAFLAGLSLFAITLLPSVIAFTLRLNLDN